MGGGYGLGSANDFPANESGADNNRVLIVVASPIDRIVISRSIERIYLKATTSAPEGVMEALDSSRPVMVIVDQSCCDEALVREVARRRAASAAGLPRVLLITETTGSTDASSRHGIVDQVFAKPITPEALQPVVERLAGKSG